MKCEAMITSGIDTASRPPAMRRAANVLALSATSEASRHAAVMTHKTIMSEPVGIRVGVGVEAMDLLAHRLVIAVAAEVVQEALADGPLHGGRLG